MTGEPRFTMQTLAKEALDEVGMRRRVYGNAVANKRMLPATAERRIAMMARIHELLELLHRNRKFVVDALESHDFSDELYDDIDRLSEIIGYDSDEQTELGL